LVALLLRGSAFLEGGRPIRCGGVTITAAPVAVDVRLLAVCFGLGGIAGSGVGGRVAGFSRPVARFSGPISAVGSVEQSIASGLPAVGCVIALVGGGVPSVGVPIPLVGDPVAFVGDPVAFVGGQVPFGRSLVAFVAPCAAHLTVALRRSSARVVTGRGVSVARGTLGRHVFRMLHCGHRGDGGGVACESVLRDRSLVAGDPLLTAHFDLSPTRRAPSQARWLVAGVLSGSAAPPGAADVSYTAQLLVSELVTNGLMHARTELHLGISGDARTLLFAVADGHPDLPPDPRTAASTVEAADIDYEGESGRGMAIIVGLAADFGWRRRDDDTGKVMWFTLTLPATDPLT
jgi:anti-sigma regulatory factor (Ser/Thr protein kinase)